MKRILPLLLLIGAICPVAAQYAFDPDLMERLRTEYRAADPNAVQAVERVAKTAEKFLSVKPLTVTAKKRLPPSTDKRDYQTQSPYWWADPSKEDGMPYIRRDGERNPEVYEYPERENAGRLSNMTRTLGLLYYVTDDERYAVKCAELLRVWFLDAKLGMNPNMTYAQMIPGRVVGRGAGIIDARHMTYALNAAALIDASPAWTVEDRAGLRQWASAFLYWLEHSTNGQKEMAASNNHGVWYDAIRLIAARTADETDRVREIAEQSLAPRFAAQVAEDGSLPAELARTLSLHYSTFTLEALSVARNMAADTGYDLWMLPEAQRALAYLIPYYENPETWPHAQIAPFAQRRAAVLLYEAGRALDKSDWIGIARRIGYKDGKADYETMLFFELQ